MAKLGYTWYPKDWGSSENVFELTLSERGLYRELIDLAMLNDNKTEIKIDVWSRKFAIDGDGLKSILGRLMILNLIEINGDNLFIPSCENRLKLVRGGSKGGRISKPISKPMSKPFEILDEKKEKPIANQTKTKKKLKVNIKESKSEIKEEIYKSFGHLKISFDEFEKLKIDFTEKEILDCFDRIENYKENTKYKSLYLTAKNWLNKEKTQNKNNNGQITSKQQFKFSTNEAIKTLTGDN